MASYELLYSDDPGRAEVIHSEEEQMSSSYELLYFDGPGRAEVIRICLFAAGIDFTDKRFQFDEWQSKIKSTTPLGQVPVLMINHQAHCQSIALSRYAGKLGGFYPLNDDDPLEALKVDEALDTLNELIDKFPAKGNSPEETWKERRKEFEKGTMKHYANFVEGMIQANGGCYVASAPSIGDLMVHMTVKGVQGGFFDHIDTKFFDVYPGIMATSDAIGKHEKVVAYYASRK